MKLEWELTGDIRLITGHGEGWVAIDGARYTTNLILTPSDIHLGWASAGWSALDEAAIDALLAYQPEVLLLASGPRLTWPPKPAMARLAASGVGFEVMALGAACRTYNVLASEGRRVVAGLVLQ